MRKSRARYSIKMLVCANGYITMCCSWSKPYQKMLARKSNFVPFEEVVWC